MRNDSPERDGITARRHGRVLAYVGIYLTAAAALLAFSALAGAQSTSPAAAATPASNAKSAKATPTARASAKPSGKFDSRDFSGVWNPAPFMQPKGEVNPLDLGGNPNPLPPFSPPGRATYEANKKFVAAGDVTSCDPYGTARNFFTPRPFEVINAKDRVLQHFEYYSDWREIFTDGRSYPDDLEPDYMGYSLGKWEGDAFVVDSKGYNGKQFLTWQGFPISQEMHQTERWQRLDRNTLKILFTFDDPKNYAKSWSITYFWKLKDYPLDAHPCTISELKEWDERMGHVDGLPGLDYTKPSAK
jgi:hypothetical protein